VGVKDRQGMQQHVLRGEPPFLRQSRGIRQQVVLRQHRPFRSARGAGSVEKRGKIICAALNSVKAIRRAFRLCD
jgi:hypothetical protein